ncbi:BREX-1 system adenine-specific DNA-methyltransferase PglX [Pirellulales bacterium]|nr:BREX-1 system adenine-specific DNA-methyltransferase PglX [Pirellulales bacterium]
MDQDTRNALQRATQKIRQILEDEFAEQLEGIFDIHSDGTILPEPGKHLDASGRLTRQKLVDAIEHIRANGKNADEAVDEYRREAAFTFLNRFVALQMLESRDLLQECVSKGDQSGGFREFCGLAPGLSGVPDAGYRLYLECLCDELSVEVKVLFDRRDSASLLWPRRGALTEVIGALGQSNLKWVWGEDEVIGWVYQYFNSGDERKRMRELSQAPRNSHELAVRNQFFTPRYVVKFLTDNTLGRLWYEMRKGKTKLIDACQYLVRRQSEVFLCEGHCTTEQEYTGDGKLTDQHELLRKPVHIPHRQKKDPRDIRILDPACGSGHFLLYAFDLLVTIYQEAWSDESGAKSEATGKSLQEDYGNEDDLLRAIPGLIVQRNLYGIDIDRRATQIASLALWTRSQRAFNDFAIARNNRPSVTKSNLVCAEAMPGDAVLLDDFVQSCLSTTPEDRLLGQLLRAIFQEMQTAGIAGTLLRIDERIAAYVSDARNKWAQEPEQIQKSLFDIADVSEGQLNLDFDVSEITDESFWEVAEHRIYRALLAYADAAGQTQFSQRLFADDAALGFAFIDVCRERYDVVLMNPPFGDSVISNRDYMRSTFPLSWKDLFHAFVEIASTLIVPGGLIGALGPRTGLFLVNSKDWRREYLLGTTHLSCLADLGIGVLDEAKVEAAAMVLCNQQAEMPSIFFRGIKTFDKERSLLAMVKQGPSQIDQHLVFVQNHVRFRALPASAIAYWVSPAVQTLYETRPQTEGVLGNARVGLQTSDDFRFIRARWEVPFDSMHERWFPLAKGGEYSPFYADIHLVTSWKDNGKEVREFNRMHYGSDTKNVRSSDRYGEPGVTWSPRTTTEFAPRVLPAGCIFGQKGPTLLVDSPRTGAKALAVLNNRLYQYMLSIGAGAAEIDPASISKSYGVGLIQSTPVPVNVDGSSTAILECFTTRRLDDAISNVTSTNFVGITHRENLSNVTEWLHTSIEQTLAREASVLKCWSYVDSGITDDYGVDSNVIDEVGYEVGGVLSQSQLKENEAKDTDLFKRPIEFGLVRQLALKNSISPEQAVERLMSHDGFTLAAKEVFASEAMDYYVGCAFGLWNHDFAKHRDPSSLLNSAFEDEPSTPPGLHDCLRGDPSQLCDRNLLVDDPGLDCDIARAIGPTLSRLWSRDATSVSDEFGEVFGRPLREWVRKEFFENHIKRYSKSRRRAPVYWQLATHTASYAVWLCYHYLSKDTFFKVLNEYVKPKLDHERQKLDRLLGEAGAEPTRSERKEIEVKEKFVAELASMVEEVERIAPLWNPNLNDGVIINFAPLWRLVPQNKSWQKECKKVWDKLVAGDYDWAHLAMHLWPERVVPKCVTDASLAIAHGLEGTFWTQDDRDRFQPLEEPGDGWQPIIDTLVAERTSPAVKAALQSLRDAPAPAAKKTSRRKAKSRD